MHGWVYILQDAQPLTHYNFYKKIGYFAPISGENQVYLDEKRFARLFVKFFRSGNSGLALFTST